MVASGTANNSCKKTPPERGIHLELTAYYGSARRHRIQRHAPKTYKCGLAECQPFSDARSLERHLKTAKAHLSMDAPLFHCQCGSQTSRKDHHRRHIRDANCHQTGLFRCWCGRTTRHRSDHEDHFRLCSKPGSRGRGRPRKIQQQERIID